MKIEEQAKQLNSRDLKSIPNGWRLMNIGDIGNIVTGSTPSTNNEKFYNGEWLFISPSDIGFKKYIVDSIKKLSDEGIKVSRKLPVGTVAVTCIGELGKVGILQKECATNQQINAVICDSDIIDNEYFYYAMQQYKGQLNIIAGLQVVPIVNKTQFSRIVLPVPTNLSEQKKIAEVLASIDNVIETTKKLINKYKKVKQGLMQDLFTRGVLPDGRLRPSFKEEPQIYKCTDLGYVPKEWNVKTLGQVCNIVSGGTPDRACPEYWEGGTIPWATPTDITGNNGRVINKTKEYITKKGLRNSSAKIVPPGSLLMTSRATIGEIKINEVEMCTNQGFKTLVPYEEIDSWFLYYQMRFFKQKYEALGSGSTFLEVSKKDTDKFAILVPNKIEEQRQIRDVLLNIDSAIEKNEQMIMKFNEIKLGLMQDLLTGKVRVKVEGDRDE
jgi:type I restriction enzyme S subunit